MSTDHAQILVIAIGLLGPITALAMRLATRGMVDGEPGATGDPARPARRREAAAGDTDGFGRAGSPRSAASGRA